MMRGSINETAALSAVSAKKFISAVYECGMLGLKFEIWITCSPDAFEWIKTKDIGFIDMDDTSVAPFKNSVATSSVFVFLGLATCNVITCTTGDATFIETVPLHHFGQLVQKSTVLDFTYIICVSASETVLLFICVVFVPHQIIAACHNVLTQACGDIVSWAH